MKVAIINLTGGGMCGGYKKYLTKVIPRLVNSDNITSILCAFPDTLNVNEWFPSLNKVTFINCLPFHFFYKDKNLQKELEKFSPDIIFLPIDRYVKFNNVPTINLIRSMLPMVSIENNTIRETSRNRIQKYVSKIAVKKADRVIAISNFVKNYLVNEWQISSDKIGMIYHGIDVDLKKETERPLKVPQKLEGKFLFTAGSVDPYRGLEDLFFSLNHFLSKNIDKKLVIAGDTRPAMLSYSKKLKKLAEKLNITSHIYWVGNLNEKQMGWCYKNCQAFVMTTRVEACPNIALEAMSYGCSIISSNNPPLPEFFIDNAIYYTKKDYISLYEAICKIINLSNDSKFMMSQKAMKRASEFSWDKTVEGLIKEFKNAIEDKKLRVNLDMKIL